MEFNTVKCPFLFIPTFQLKCSRRAHARPDDSIYQHFFFRILIPSGMNTVNYYPADNCGSCKAFPDFPESPQMLPGCTLCLNSAAFDIFSPCPPAGPPVGVGMNIDIASIDMVSEVNMVSGSLSPLSFFFFTIAGQMINALYVPVRGNTLHHHWRSPFRCSSAFPPFFFRSHTHTDL